MVVQLRSQRMHYRYVHDWELNGRTNAGVLP